MSVQRFLAHVGLQRREAKNALGITANYKVNGAVAEIANAIKQNESMLAFSHGIAGRELVRRSLRMVTKDV